MKTAMRHMRPTVGLKTSLSQPMSEKEEKIKYPWVKTSLEVTSMSLKEKNKNAMIGIYNLSINSFCHFAGFEDSGKLQNSRENVLKFHSIPPHVLHKIHDNHVLATLTHPLAPKIHFQALSGLL